MIAVIKFWIVTILIQITTRWIQSSKKLESSLISTVYHFQMGHFFILDGPFFLDSSRWCLGLNPDRLGQKSLETKSRRKFESMFPFLAMIGTHTRLSNTTKWQVFLRIMHDYIIYCNTARWSCCNKLSRCLFSRFPHVLINRNTINNSIMEHTSRTVWAYWNKNGKIGIKFMP